MNPLPLFSNDKKLQYWYTASGYPLHTYILCASACVCLCSHVYKLGHLVFDPAGRSLGVDPLANLVHKCPRATSLKGGYR